MRANHDPHPALARLARDVVPAAVGFTMRLFPLLVWVACVCLILLIGGREEPFWLCCVVGFTGGLCASPLVVP